MLKDYIVIDLETTGLNPKLDKIIEIGGVKVKGGKVESIYETFVNPGRIIPERITEVTGITDIMVKDAPYIEEIIGDFIEYTENLSIIGHNLMFDYGFLKHNAVNNNFTFDRMGIDTLKIARVYLSDLESRRLDSLCEYFHISDENHHRAVNDAAATRELYEILCTRYEKDNIEFKPYELIYKAKKQSPITEKQAKYLKDLISCHGINPEYDVNKLTKNEASRIIDKIILEYGRIF